MNRITDIRTFLTAESRPPQTVIGPAENNILRMIRTDTTRSAEKMSSENLCPICFTSLENGTGLKMVGGAAVEALREIGNRHLGNGKIFRQNTARIRHPAAR